MIWLLKFFQIRTEIQTKFLIGISTDMISMLYPYLKKSVVRNHKGALLTINDRVTGLLVWIRLLSGKDASPLTKAAIDALEPFRDQIHTITADNGKEFSFHEEIARKLNIFVYFAKPYHSWERGANENSNGLIRQYFPKGTDFRDITNEQVMRVQNILNSRPRKRLGYMTPKEKYKLLTNNEFDTVALSV